MNAKINNLLLWTAVVALLGFAISNQIEDSDLQDQQVNVIRDVQQLKQDMRGLRAELQSIKGNE